MMGESEADGPYHRHKMEFEHPCRGVADEGRDDDQQFIHLRVGLADVVDYGDVAGQGLLQIVRTFVVGFEQQGCRLLVDEGDNAVVYIVDVTRYGPTKTLLEGVERPESCIVALGRDDGLGTKHRGNLLRQVVGPSDMS